MRRTTIGVVGISQCLRKKTVPSDLCGKSCCLLRPATVNDRSGAWCVPETLARSEVLQPAAAAARQCLVNPWRAARSHPRFLREGSFPAPLGKTSRDRVSLARLDAKLEQRRRLCPVPA